MDDIIGTITGSPIARLNTSETVVLTATGIAKAGQYENNVTATGTPPEDSDVSASEKGHYLGVQASIAIVKLTNDVEAPSGTGPHIPVGDIVTWKYRVTNTGEFNLTNVTVVDDIIGTITGSPISRLNASETVVLTATGIAKAGQYENNVTATGTPPLDAPDVSASEKGHYFGQVPGIMIIKKTNDDPAQTKPGPYIPEGSAVIWTYEVTNTGNVNLTNVEVNDNVTGAVGTIALLHPGQTNSSLTVTGIASSGQYTNIGNSTGTTPTGSKVSDENLSHYYGSLPAINLSKEADRTNAKVGEEIVYTFTIKNVGNNDITITDLKDTYLSSFTPNPIGTILTPKGTSGDILIVTGKYAVIDTDLPGPIVNIATVDGKDSQGNKVNSTDTATVSLGALVVTKTADPTFGSPSTNVTFTLQVNNSGSTPLPHVYVNDQLPLGMSYRSSSSGGRNVGQIVYWSDIGPLEAGASKPLQIVAHIDGPVSGIQTLTNRVDVEGKPEHGGNVTNNTTTNVEALEPRIEVTKTANLTSGSPCTNVAFTLTVKNTGKTKLTSVFVSDTLPEGMSYVSSEGGVNNGRYINWSDIGSLDVDASKPLQIVAHIDGPVSGIQTLTNRVDVEGKPEHGGNVTANATADVQAQEAEISVTKKATPTFGSKGTLVNFTMIVTNNGDAPLLHVYVEDLLPAGLTYDSSSSGSSQSGKNVYWPDIGGLDVSDTKQLWIKATIDGTLYDNLTNKVDVEGKPEHGGNVTANATADVQAQEAEISVTKIAKPTFGSKGTLINFTMNVTNNGDSPLLHVYVEDLLPAGLTYDSSSPVSTHSGQNVYWSDIGPMASSEKKTLWIKATIDGSVYGTLTNQVDVEGQPEYGDNVTDSATATVEAGKAEILVTKIANPTFGSVGTLVNFTLDVTNSGDSLLSHVFVRDLLPDGLVYDSSSSGGVNAGQTVYWSDIGPLESGLSKSLWIKALIDGSKLGLLTNIVDVEGQPQYGENVTGRATADVTAFESGIMVEKTAVPDHGAAGTIVRFSLAVTNTARIDLKNVFVSDKLPEDMSYVASDGGINNGLFINWSDIGPLSNGAPAKMLWIDARIDGPITESEILTNRVDVEGRPEYGSNVTGFATANVEAQAAGIIVDKVANPSEGSKGAIITFPMTITNQETMKMVKVKGVDTLPLGLKYIPDGTTPEPSSNVTLPDGRMQITWDDLGPLNSKESHDLTLKAGVTGTVMGTLTNEIKATGVPEYGENVYAYDTADVLVQSASINVTKVAYPPEGIPGEKITFTVVINNTGSVTLCSVHCDDILPDGLLYLKDDHNGTFTQPNMVVWEDLGCLEPGESIRITIETEIIGTILGNLTNEVHVKGWPYCARARQKDLSSDPATSQCGDPVEDTAKATVNANPEPYVITKTSDKSSYRPGEEMTYTITIRNIMLYQYLKEVVVKDVFQDSKVQIIASYPESDDGQWYFDSIEPKGLRTIILVAVYPASNMTFDLGESAVSGSGFVNVHNDLSTGTSPFPVTNCVYVTAKIYDTNSPEYTSWSREKCYSVTIADAGTELLTREHGSGDYQTEEKTKLFMKNRSIESSKSVS
ncbi:MAG: hypothetical protein NTY37_10120, partial [Methanothrix sp.]|nr:hypothetical protein [Methanothrix sp.]